MKKKDNWEKKIRKSERRKVYRLLRQKFKEIDREVLNSDSREGGWRALSWGLCLLEDAIHRVGQEI